MAEEKILEVLQRIENSLQRKESDMIISSKSSDYTLHFEKPLYVTNAKVALKLFSMYYSIPNVNASNNNFRYKSAPDTEWEDIYLETGSYEIHSIAVRIKEIMETGDAPTPNDLKARLGRKPPSIKFRVDPATMKCVIDIPEGHRVDFFPLSSIGNILGFLPEELGPGTHISNRIVDINPVNSLLVHCSVVDGGLINGKPSNCIYSFDPKVAPGYKIVEEPNHLVFYPISNITHMSKLRIWLTDDEGKFIDTRDEKMTITLTIKI